MQLDGRAFSDSPFLIDVQPPSCPGVGRRAAATGGLCVCDPPYQPTSVSQDTGADACALPPPAAAAAGGGGEKSSLAVIVGPTVGGSVLLLCLASAATFAVVRKAEKRKFRDWQKKARAPPEHPCAAALRLFSLIIIILALPLMLRNAAVCGGDTHSRGPDSSD